CADLIVYASSGNDPPPLAGQNPNIRDSQGKVSKKPISRARSERSVPFNLLEAGNVSASLIASRPRSRPRRIRHVTSPLRLQRYDHGFSDALVLPKPSTGCGPARVPPVPAERGGPGRARPVVRDVLFR